MRLDRTPTGVRLAEDEEVYLDLSLAQYEDIFYAVPLEPANLFMLVNDTVITEADDRAILSFVIEANGGMEQAMKTLQDLVQALPPNADAAPAPAPAAAAPAPVVEAPKPVVASPAEVEPFELTEVEIAREEPEAPPPAPVERAPVASAPAEAPPTPESVTRRFEKKAPPPVTVEIGEGAKRVKIKCGSTTIDIDIARYEDLFYALPGENASIYRLLNDTILSRSEERDILRDMVGILGGLDPGMTAIQNAVAAVVPPKRETKRYSSKAPMAGKPASTVQPAKTGGRPASVPGRPASSVNPGVARPASRPPLVAAKPGAPALAGKPASTVQPARPPVSTVGGVKPPVSTVGGVKPPASTVQPAKPGSAPPRSGGVPAAPKPPPGPPKPTGPRPITVDEVELVDDVEVIPVAPVDQHGPGAVVSVPQPAAPKPGAAPVKPAAGPASVRTPAAPAKPGQPASVVQPAQPASKGPPHHKKKEIQRTGQTVEVKMSKEDVERTGVKIKVSPQGYQIICREYFILLSKAQYQELHYALPMPVMNMFKLIHNDLLKDPQSRGVLMKMIHLAGGPKEFMSALTMQVQQIKPTENWQ